MEQGQRYYEAFTKHLKSTSMWGLRELPELCCNSKPPLQTDLQKLYNKKSSPFDIEKTCSGGVAQEGEEDGPEPHYGVLKTAGQIRSCLG